MSKERLFSVIASPKEWFVVQEALEFTLAHFVEHPEGYEENIATLMKFLNHRGLEGCWCFPGPKLPPQPPREVKKDGSRWGTPIGELLLNALTKRAKAFDACWRE